MNEILDKETILDWAESEPEVEPELREKFETLCKDFIEHLREESDSSEDDSSEGDESSSEGSDDN